jgi:hypothetical protein
MHADTQYEVKNAAVSSEVSIAAGTLLEHEEAAKDFPVNGPHPVKISVIANRMDGAAEEHELTWNELAKMFSAPTVNQDGLVSHAITFWLDGNVAPVEHHSTSDTDVYPVGVPKSVEIVGSVGGP